MKQNSFAISNVQFDTYLKILGEKSDEPSEVRASTSENGISKSTSSGNGSGMGGLDKAKLRVAVIGAGAMGSLVAGKLSKADFDVTLITSWQDHLEAINERGLLVRSLAEDGKLLGDVTSVPICTPDTITHFTSRGPADVIFILTKVTRPLTLLI